MFGRPARLLACSLILIGLTTSLLGDEQEDWKRRFLDSRSPAARKKLLREEGGSAQSEKAVADGLHWLALHQAQDGHWSLNQFNKCARQKPWPAGRVGNDGSTPGTNRQNDVAATAMALLPFLAAGITHRAPPGGGVDSYHKGVGAGLRWLMSRQSKGQGAQRGFFGGDTYAHALATLALCEAYHMTRDPKMKASAQAGVDYLIAAQHANGGWRYLPKQAGDLSVTGFVMRALKAGQVSGLKVPTEALKKAEKFIDSVESTNKGGYIYIPGSSETISMTAVGALCRQYLGVNPRNPSLLASAKQIKRVPPGSGNIYYEYYATRVMFNMGGDDWRSWNLGPDGSGKGGIRDTLIAKQEGKAGNKGSWAGTEQVGGRLGATSFSLLTLQVYYRYPGLYRAKADKDE
jgi:hypothetical protein